MAVTFPLGVTEFWQELRFAGRPEFALQMNQQASTDAAGNSLIASFGSPKWVSDVVTSPGLHAKDAKSAALIKAVIARNGSFLAYDISRKFPLYDKTGSIVGSSSVLVNSKGGNNRSLSLKGLPAGYVLNISDKLSITDGTGKRALMEVVESVTANGSGVTAEFEVTPFLFTWIAVNQAVDLTSPLGKFKISPGSYRPASASGNMRGGMSFSMYSTPS